MKIIQLISHKNTLYALTEDGKAYEYVYDSKYKKTFWNPLPPIE